LVLTLALPLFWVPPDLIDLALMVAIGAVAGFGHMILVVAYSLAPASTLTPFLYSQVLSAALFTVFWFGEALSPMVILGAMVLVASGILLWWQERRANRRAVRIHGLG
jgi:drug/metabolite transporter (DMT)-like permease